MWWCCYTQTHQSASSCTSSTTTASTTSTTTRDNNNTDAVVVHVNNNKIYNIQWQQQKKDHSNNYYHNSNKSTIFNNLLLPLIFLQLQNELPQHSTVVSVTLYFYLNSTNCFKMCKYKIHATIITITTDDISSSSIYHQCWQLQKLLFYTIDLKILSK